MKRFIDIFGGLIGFLVLIAITPFIAIMILLEDGWPIFIQQRRVSKGKIINVYKFRSMVKNAEELKKNLLNKNERSDGPFFKIKNDPRITKVGKFLRRTRLDEFPQFVNVLKGDLSIVGPRPHEPEEIFQYPERYKKICLEKGGITCLSQVNEKPFLLFEKEMELDMYYIEHKSLLLDIKIIMKTIEVFLRKPDGI
ncbi:MAG: sugar transferase [bacterium]|nr:sugar transferase [bacterium]